VPGVAGAVRRGVASPSLARAVALAGPGSRLSASFCSSSARAAAAIADKREVHSQGYDIVLAVDLSGSMLAEDYVRDGRSASNRLPAIKPVIRRSSRSARPDRIGVVAVSGRAYTMAPLTFDHDWLAKQLERVRIGMIEDGTAIGDGLGCFAHAARTGETRKRRQTPGARSSCCSPTAPTTAAHSHRNRATELAKARGIPVYTIGAGQDGLVALPRLRRQGRKILLPRIPADLDEGALRESPTPPAGNFSARSTRHGRERVQAIDQAQKIEFQVEEYLLTTELFNWVAAPDLACSRSRRCSRDPRGGKERRVRTVKQHTPALTPPSKRGINPRARSQSPLLRGVTQRRVCSPMSFAWPDLLGCCSCPSRLLVWAHAPPSCRGVAHPKILRAEAGARSPRIPGRRRSTRRARQAARVAVPRARTRCVALARPQWGRLEEPVFDQSREILLAQGFRSALDGSRKTPSPKHAASCSSVARWKNLPEQRLVQPSRVGRRRADVAWYERRLRNPARGGFPRDWSNTGFLERPHCGARARRQRVRPEAQATRAAWRAPTG